MTKRAIGKESKNRTCSRMCDLINHLLGTYQVGKASRANSLPKASFQRNTFFRREKNLPAISDILKVQFNTMKDTQTALTALCH